MELLSVGTAKVAWFFDFGEFNPQGKDVLIDLVDWLKDTYSFEKFPNSLTDMNPETKALDFKIGRFEAREEVFITVELSIYSDAVIANSWSSTRETEAFLDDVFSRAAKEFHLNYHPKLIRRKTYLSEVHMRCDHALSTLNPKIKEVTNRIASLAGRSCDLSGVAFWFDPMVAPDMAVFKFERKAKTAFTEDRYFSSAPLQTKDHLSVLEDLEKLLAT